jgi:hypothetical protein
MKKQLAICCISICMITGATFTTYAQKDKKNDHKEQKGKENKQHNPGEKNDAKGPKSKVVGNNGKNGNAGNGQDNKNWNKGKDKNNNDNQATHNANKNKHELAGSNNNKHNTNNVYYWTNETFKDRNKVKNQGKVSICHKFRSGEPAVNIRVSTNAVQAHLNHGDVTGDCPAVSNTSFSNLLLKRRTDYYNTVQNTQEQVSYSRSILDYALMRLTDSRVQLATYKANNLPQVEIERKQAAVVTLEENVTLLEVLVGAAANILIDKLQ